VNTHRLLVACLAVLTLAAPAACVETKLTTVDAGNTHPSWHRGSGYIAYETDRNYDVTNIRYMSEPSRWDTWVTQDATLASGDPCWDDSRTYCFFQRADGSGRNAIWGKDPSIAFSVDYSSPGSGHDRAPAFLAGAGFVLHSSRSGDDEVCWMSEGGEGGGFTELTANASQDRYPCWSPDGNWVAFASDRSGDWDIWVMSAAGEADTVWQLTADAADESGPDWSPSGEFVAFHRGGSGIIAVDVASRTEHQVTVDGTDAWPSWSGSGDRIAFARGTAVAHIWMTDNVPTSGVESVSWGRLKALFR